MDFKAALSQLKKVGPKVSLPFLYVEADAKGKPAILVGNAIASEKAKVLAGVKSPKIATGKMSISDDSELVLKAKGNALGTLKAAVTKAGATSVVKTVRIGSPDPEDADDAPGQDNAAPTPTAPAASGWNTGSSTASGQAPRINLGSQRAAPAATPGQGTTAYTDTVMNAPVSDGTTAYTDTVMNTPVSDGTTAYTDTVMNTPVSEGTTAYTDTVMNDQAGGSSTAPKPASAWTPATAPGKAGQPPVPPPRPILPAKPVAPAKKFPDVLRQSPAMAKLLDQRDILRRALEEAGPNPKIAPERRAAVIAKLAEMEGQLEAAQRQLNDTGFVPKQVGAEYAGEHEKVGWRADRDKPVEPRPGPNATPEQIADLKEAYAQRLAHWEKVRETATVVTRRFDDQERKENELFVNEEGRILNAEGKPLNTTVNTEYVMDAEDGKLYQFDGGSMVKDGNMVPNARGRMVEQKATTHHSSVLGGGEVAGAGGFKVVDGKLTQITNVSGHYKPGVGQTVQTVETLLKQGALLNKEWVDKDGKPLAGKVAELYERCKVIQQKVAAKLQADPDADVAGDRKSIDAAMAMLGKLGAGPRNSITDATVGMLGIKAGMTGINVAMAGTEVENKAIPAADFLRSGGGNQKQADAKAKMQEQLRDGMAGDRERLERTEGVTKDGVGAATVSEQELADAAIDLGGPGTRSTDVARTGDQAVRSENNETGEGTAGPTRYTHSALEEEEPAHTSDPASPTRYATSALEEEEPAHTSDAGNAAEGSTGPTKYSGNLMSGLNSDADDADESAEGGTHRDS